MKKEKGSLVKLVIVPFDCTIHCRCSKNRKKGKSLSSNKQMKRKEVVGHGHKAKKTKQDHVNGVDADLYHSQPYWEERYQKKEGYHEW